MPIPASSITSYNASSPTSRAYWSVRQDSVPSEKSRRQFENSSAATLGVLDLFQSDAQQGALHGDNVRSVIVKAGFSESEVAKIDNSPSSESNKALCDLLYAPDDESFSDRVDAYIELSATAMLSKTNGTLRSLLEGANPGLRTLNQSQGTTRADVYQLLTGAAFLRGGSYGSLTDVGLKMVELLGVKSEDPSERAKELCQACIDRVQTVVDQSATLKEAQTEHAQLVQDLREKGITLITSAGNSADELWQLRNQGFRVDDSFDDDVTSVGPKIVVGAVDPMGTAWIEDDQVAYFSSDYPGVNLMAPGVGVATMSGPETGTSFAAPLVTAEFEKIRRSHPQWTIAELERDVSAKFRVPDAFRLNLAGFNTAGS